MESCTIDCRTAVDRVSRHHQRVRSRASLALKRLVDTSVKLGLGLATLASLALGASALVGGPEGLVIATIAGPILAIAIVNLIFESFSRNAIAQDIREMLGREHRVIETGLRDMMEGRDAVSAAVVATSASVTVMPWHPTQWAERDFRPLCELARSRQLALRVFVPAPEETMLIALADRLGAAPSMLTPELARLPDELCGAWDGVGVDENSTLEVWTYPGLPAFGLLISDAVSAIDLGPAVRRGPFDASSQLSLYEPGSPMARSISDQLAAVEQEGARAGVRPLRAPAPRGGQPHSLAAHQGEAERG